MEKTELAERIAKANEVLLTHISGGSGQFRKYTELTEAERDMIVAALKRD